jgi:hypothetical protein
MTPAVNLPIFIAFPECRVVACRYFNPLRFFLLTKHPLGCNEYTCFSCSLQAMLKSPIILQYIDTVRRGMSCLVRCFQLHCLTSTRSSLFEQRMLKLGTCRPRFTIYMVMPFHQLHCYPYLRSEILVDAKIGQLFLQTNRHRSKPLSCE